MPVIDDDLIKPHVKEERKLRFGEFVKSQKDAGMKGMPNACLQTEGYRDFFGKLELTGGYHENFPVLPVDKNGKALLYKERKDAVGYAKDLQKILREKGYGGSLVWVERVAVRKASTRPYTKLMAPSYSFESEPRFLIRMIVK